MLYFDNNATTAASSDVVAAMLPFFGQDFGNPSSTHALGEHAADAIRAARASVARLVGARSPDEIVFTSGGTESINTAIRAAVAAQPARRVVLTGTTEHSAVLDTLASLEKSGTRVVRIGVSRAGHLDRDALDRELSRECALVTLMLANNETGVVSDLSGIGARCRELGVAFHVDMVQAAGKLPVDVNTLGADLASVSSHKIHGPKGAGALYVRNGFTCAPLLFGGSQERRVRPGTENVPAIVGFGRAAIAARESALDERTRTRIAALRDELERGILGAVPGSRVNGDPRARVPNTTSCVFAGLEAEALLASFSSSGLCASAGSACHAQARTPSHVLLAMGLTPAEAAACVRFSLSRYTTAEEVARALEIVASSAADLRSLAGS